MSMTPLDTSRVSCDDIRMTLREHRKQAGMTQQQLADAIGSTQRAVVRWELFQVMPNRERREQLAVVLGVSASAIDWHGPSTTEGD